MELHDQALGRLVQRIERQPASRVSEGGIVFTSARQPLRQLLQRGGQLQPQALSLEGLPGIELDGICEGEAGQEVGAVQSHRFGEGGQAVVAEPAEGIVVGGNLRQQIVEARDVHLKRRRLACHLIPFDRQRAFADGLAEIGKGAAQHRAASFAVELRPQQRHQRIATVGLAYLAVARQATARYASSASALRRATVTGTPSRSMRGLPKRKMSRPGIALPL